MGSRTPAILRFGVGVISASVIATLLVVPAGRARAQTCTKTWDGGAGSSSWADAANWNPDGVPTAVDFLCITGANVALPIRYKAEAASMDASASTVTVPKHSSLALLSKTDPSTVESLILGGSVGGGSPVAVTGGITMLSSARLLSGGMVTLAASSSSSLQGTISRPVILLGAASLYSYGTLELKSTFDIQGGPGIAAGGVGGYIMLNGTLEKTAGDGTSTVAVPVTFTYNGARAIEVDAGTLAFTNGFVYQGTLSGSTFRVNSPGALQFAAPNVTALASGVSLTLSGPDASVKAADGSDGLAKLAANGGALTLEDGATVGTTASFTNGGTLSVRTGSHLTDTSGFSNSGSVNVSASGTISAASFQNSASVLLDSGGRIETTNGGYGQTGGTSTLNQVDTAIACSGTGAAVTIQGGTLRGIGTVGPALVDQSGGTIVPGPNGSTYGTLHIDGPYEEAGTLTIGVRGTAVGTGFGQVAANGPTTLDPSSRLVVSTAPSFTPQIGQVFPILTYESLSGSFGSMSGLKLNSSVEYDPETDPHTFELVVAQAYPPDITGFSPSSGVVGTTVTITGSHLLDAKSVAFGGQYASFTVVSDTEIEATVPFGASTGPISVTSFAGTGTSSEPFLVAPKIAGFSPSSGPVGAYVTINGSAFLGTTKVTFGGIDASFTVASYSQIDAIVPAGATTGSIRVFTPSGVAKSPSPFVVT